MTLLIAPSLGGIVVALLWHPLKPNAADGFPFKAESPIQRGHTTKVQNWKEIAWMYSTTTKETH